MSTCPLPNTEIAQIGFVVRDLEKTKQQVARFLGVEVPPTVSSGEYAVTQTVYKGEPAPDTACTMAFFYFGNVQVEFIQPNEGPSVWRDFLETKGEGVHHFAFRVQGSQEYTRRCEEWGMVMEQKGEYRGGNGRYVYMNALEDLKIFIEMLESDEPKG
ncbi:MAG: VOC family protein [Candidatus Limiplasma sp.]|nr:VOC family protein [Candidatus Limiplasma sp.]